MYSAVMAAGAGETVANVYVFRKFTIPDDKVFIMDVFEKDGGRHQSFTVRNTDLVDALSVPELKMR